MIGLGIFLPVVLEENAKTKECSCCKVVKSINLFSNQKRNTDGKDYTCKACKNEQYKKRCKLKQKNLIICLNKVCIHCKTNKVIGEFHKNHKNKDGHENYCKDCSLIKSRKKRANNKFKNKNKLIIPFSSKICPTCGIDKNIQCYSNSNGSSEGKVSECKDCISIRSKRSHKRNIAACRERKKKRLKNDLEYRIYNEESSNQGKLIKEALGKKCLRTSPLLGCSILEYIKHLESKFEPGMKWENKGTLWHVDHIIPRTVFNLKLPEHQIIFFNHKNQMPRWATNRIAREHGSFQMGNIEKSDKILPEFEYLLEEYGLK